MSISAEQLEKFFNQHGRADLAQTANGLYVEAKAIEDSLPTPKIEIPARIRQETLTRGNKSREKLLAECTTPPYHVSDPASYIIDQTKRFSGGSTDETLIWQSGYDLGITQRAPYNRFLEAGQAKGFNLIECPGDLSLDLRLFDANQPKYEWYWLAMNPILDQDRDLRVLGLGHYDDGLWVDTTWTDPDDLWDPESRIVFSVSK